MNQNSLVITRYSQIPAAAKRLAKKLEGGEVIGLLGPLGSGKTEFTRALAKHLGVINTVTSPTFTLLNQYPARKDLYIYHIDTYRMEGTYEANSIGIQEFLGEPHIITIIEWADKITPLLPPTTIYVTLATTP